MLKEIFGDRLEVEWRSYLLIPEKRDRTLEKFRQYTQSWLKVASDKPGGSFQTWSTQEQPPSHSIPPHLVAKAAAQVDESAFELVHDALLTAYFVENRDISAETTLKSIWVQAGLDEAQLSTSQDPTHLKSVIDEHNEACQQLPISFDYGRPWGPCWEKVYYSQPPRSLLAASSQLVRCFRRHQKYH